MSVRKLVYSGIIRSYIFSICSHVLPKVAIRNDKTSIVSACVYESIKRGLSLHHDKLSDAFSSTLKATIGKPAKDIWNGFNIIVFPCKPRYFYSLQQ